MTGAQQAAHRLAVALLAVSGILFSTIVSFSFVHPPQAHASCTDCTGTWYGALAGYMNEAIANGIWP